MCRPNAQVAELVDALASGASGCKVVKVRVLSWAPSFSGDGADPIRIPFVVKSARYRGLLEDGIGAEAGCGRWVPAA